MKKKNSLAKKAQGNPWANRPHPRGATGHAPPNKGKTYEELYGPEKATALKKASSDRLSGTDRKAEWAAMPEEKKTAWRKRFEKIRLGGYIKGSGRGKQGWYKGYWCDSSWELAYIIYHLDHNIPIERNKEKFNYEFNGKHFAYHPDFIVAGELVEVKGYWTSQNHAKIDQCPKKISVVDKEGIKPYLNYAIEKYGKNYISLYEPQLL